MTPKKYENHSKGGKLNSQQNKIKLTKRTYSQLKQARMRPKIFVQLFLLFINNEHHIKMNKYY